MKIQLPDGKPHNLEDNIAINEKLRIVDELTNEWLDVIIQNWHSNSVKYFLDSLTNYIVWHKDEDEKGREDKEVLSRTKLEQMNKFKKRGKTVNFTDLTSDQKELLFGERGIE